MKHRVLGVLIGALALGAFGLFQAANAISPPTKTWTGTSSGSWNQSTNWSPAGVPAPGSILVFPSSASNKTNANDIPGTTNFDSIQFTGNGYDISGNPIALSNGISASNSTSPNLMSLDIQLSQAQNMDITGTQPLTLSGVISGASGAGLTKTGSGTLELSGPADNTYQGSTGVSDGILRITKAKALGDAATGTSVSPGGVLALANDITVTGEALTLDIGDTVTPLGSLHNESGDNTWTGTVTLSTSAPTQSTISSAAGKLTITGKITGTGALRTFGAGTIQFGGSPTNDYAGDTTVHNALLELANSLVDAAIPSGSTLDIGDGSTTSVVRWLNDFQMPSNTIVVNPKGIADIATFNDTVGPIDLHGGNGVLANDAQLVGTTGSFNTSGNIHAFQDSSHAFQDTSDVSAGLNINSGSPRLITVDTFAPDGPQALLNITGKLTGGNALEKNGGGVLDLSGDNSGYTGAITVTAGDLIADTNNNALGDSGADTTVATAATIHFTGGITSPESLVLNGDTGSCPTSLAPCLDKVVNDSGTNEVDGTITLASGNPAVDVVAGKLTFGGSIVDSSPDGITKDGPGTLVFSSATGNTYTGPTTVNDGKLELAVGAGSAVPASPLTIGDGSGLADTAIVQLDAADQIANAVNVGMNRDGKLDLGVDHTDQIGTLNMTGSDVVGTGTSTLKLGGDVTVNNPGAFITDRATITSKLDLNATGDRTFTVADGADVLDLDISGVVSGTGSNFKKAGLGRLRLKAANLYDGTTLVTAGTVDANDVTALGTTTTGTTVSSGATLLYSATGTYAETPLNLAGSGVGGVGALEVAPPGVVIPGSASVVLSGSTSIGVDLGDTLSINTVVSGTGSLVKVGGGSMTLEPFFADNTYTGTTTVNAGDVHLNACCAPNIAIPHDLVIGDGIGGANADRVIYDDGNEIVNSAVVTVNSSGQFDAGTGHPDTIGSLVMHGGNIIGTSTLTLSTGGVGVTQSGSIPSNIGSGITLDLDALTQTFNIAANGGGGNDLTIDGVIQNGGLTKTSAGILALTGANTYTGPTSVDAGELFVTATGSIPVASAVTVNAASLKVDGTVGDVTLTGGSTLLGTGTVGNVSVGGTSSVAPGDSPGVIHTSDLTMGSGTSLNAELGGTAGGMFDQVEVTGTVNITGATLVISEVNGFTSTNGDAFKIVDNSGTGDPVTGTFGGTLTGGGRTFSINYAGGDGNDIVITDTGAIPPSGGGGGGGGGGGDPFTRIAGNDRILTGIAASKDSYPTAGSANAVVLARSDDYPDALAGAPLAITKHAPLLLTPSHTALDSRVAAEISRVASPGKTVFILGGPSAVDPSVDTQLQSMGYTVVRLQGTDRYATAVAVAHDGLGDPATQLLVTGTDFADALAAGPVASVGSGASILLTNGSQMPPATAAYLAAHPATSRFALGGPAAAAAPTATPIVGADRFETSVKVAQQFFPNPSVVGAAYGFKFPDALAGGAHIGRLQGPMLLTDTSSVPNTVKTFLTGNRTTITAGFLYGGPAVVTDAGLAALQQAIN